MAIIGTLPGTLRGKRILAVDSNEINREIIAACLASWDCIPKVVSSGREALRLLKAAAEASTAFDVLITDMMMPEMDGMQLLKRVREDKAMKKKGIRILVAEDNRINQKVARHQLNKLGYTADIVDNGRQAVEAVKTESCRLEESS